MAAAMFSSRHAACKMTQPHNFPENHAEHLLGTCMSVHLVLMHQTLVRAVLLWANMYICTCKWQYFLNISSHFAQLQLVEWVDMNGQAFASASNTWKHKVGVGSRNAAADVHGQQRLGCRSNLSQTKITRAMAAYSALLVRLLLCSSI